ncbi:hypothetical protein [Prosthecobacter sp.]|uniref:hypothetical protein n=1 Tax=Prosthecobacter sp. TaxID=1965333 RepID=UPI00378518DB
MRSLSAAEQEIALIKLNRVLRGVMADKSTGTAFGPIASAYKRDSQARPAAADSLPMMPPLEIKAQGCEWQQRKAHEAYLREHTARKDDVYVWRAVPFGLAHFMSHPGDVHLVENDCD